MANRSVKRAMVDGLTGSAPLTIILSELRSRPATSSSRTFLQQSSKAKFGAADKGGAMLADRTQPSSGVGKKRQRRHDDGQRPVVQRAEPGTDESHVVVERQPADEDIGRSCFENLAHRADVGEKIGMGEDDALSDRPCCPTCTA